MFLTAKADWWPRSGCDSIVAMNRRFPILVLTAFVCLVTPSVVAQVSAPEKTDPAVEAGSRALSILESASWTALFNGKDLAGWKGDTEGYVVRDGVLVCQKGAKGLITSKQYADFAFRFDFKLEESANNGIGIRVPEGGHPSRDGMEIQVLDHNGSRYQVEAEVDGKKRKLTWLKPWQFHGSIYGIFPAKTGYLKPAGEWNTQTIVAIGDHILVILNGAVIVDVFLEDVTPVDGKTHPGMTSEKGHIVLAGHNDHVEFRNLELVDLAIDPKNLPAPAKDNVAPEGFAPLFNGKDLSGWKGLAHKDANKRRALKGEALKKAQSEADEIMRDHWSVVDGILTYDGKGQSLCTGQDYGDFDLIVDWKIPPGADSGIYLRGTPQIQIWDPWDPRTDDGKLPEDAKKWVEQYRNGRNLGSGSLWNNRRTKNTPLKLADREPGEWNRFFIRMVGDTVTIWLNDTLIVDRTELENYWDKTGKLPLPRADQIELQHHGSELFFKNLFIRELPY